MTGERPFSAFFCQVSPSLGWGRPMSERKRQLSLCVSVLGKTSPMLFLKSDHQNVFHVIIVERRRLFPPLMLHCLRPAASRRIGSCCSPGNKKILAHFYSNKNIRTIPDEWGAGGVERGWVAGAWICLLDDRRTRDVSSIQQQCGVCYWCGDKTRKARGATPSGMKAFLSFGQAPGVGCYFSVASLSRCWLVFI